MCPGVSDIKEHFIKTIASNRVAAFSLHHSKGQRGEKLVRCHGGAYITRGGRQGSGESQNKPLICFYIFPKCFKKPSSRKHLNNRCFGE